MRGKGGIYKGILDLIFPSYIMQKITENENKILWEVLLLQN